MDNLQRTIINTLGTQPSIDAAEEVARRVEFLVDYLRTTGAAGYVLGISGGQDSTLAGKLAQIAVDQVEGAEFYALRLPHGVQIDEDDAQVALEFIQPDHSPASMQPKRLPDAWSFWSTIFEPPAPQATF